MPAPSPPDDLVVEVVRFPAGPCSLEGELVYPEEGRPVGAAVLAGPHPLLGGSMHNNVTRGLGDGLARRGLAALRFNYRGQGVMGRPLDMARLLTEFWQNSCVAEEEEYARDLHAAVAFLIGAVGAKVPLALIGYSFGCSLLPGAAPEDVPASFVLIAPTVGKHDLEAFTRLPQPKLVIAPEEDFAVDEELLPNWFDRLPEPKTLVRPRLDGHFFRGCEEDLAQTVSSFLALHLGDAYDA